MSKNQIIKSALYISRILMVIVISFFVVFIGAIIHSRFSPGLYNNVIISESFKAGFGIGNVRICSQCADPTNILLSELNDWMAVWLAFRGAIFFVMIFLIIRNFIKIIISVESVKTFYDNNIDSFYQLARYGVLITFFSLFNFITIAEETNFHFSIPFGSIAFTMVCLVLAEVFKEGKSLLEDKNSII